jgi:hypothetical protein
LVIDQVHQEATNDEDKTKSLFAQRLRANVSKSILPEPVYDLLLMSQPFVGYVRRNEKQLARQCAMMQVALRESRANFERLRKHVDARMLALSTMNVELSDAQIAVRAAQRKEKLMQQQLLQQQQSTNKKTRKLTFQDDQQQQQHTKPEISQAPSLQPVSEQEESSSALISAVNEIEQETDTVRRIRVRSIREMYGELRLIRDSLQDSDWLFDPQQFVQHVVNQRQQQSGQDSIDVAAQSRMLVSYRDILNVERQRLLQLENTLSQWNSPSNNTNNNNNNAVVLSTDHERQECQAIVIALEELTHELLERIRQRGDWQSLLFLSTGEVDLTMDDSPYVVADQVQINREKWQFVQRQYDLLQQEFDQTTSLQRKEIERLHESLLALQRERDSNRVHRPSSMVSLQQPADYQSRRRKSSVSHAQGMAHKTAESVPLPVTEFDNNNSDNNSSKRIVVEEEYEMEKEMRQRMSLKSAVTTCDQACNTSDDLDTQQVSLSKSHWQTLQSSVTDMLTLSQAVSQMRDRRFQLQMQQNQVLQQRPSPWNDHLPGNSHERERNQQLQSIASSITQQRKTPLSLSQSVTQLDDSFVSFVQPSQLTLKRPHSASVPSSQMLFASKPSLPLLFSMDKDNHKSAKNKKRPWTSSTWKRVEKTVVELPQATSSLFTPPSLSDSLATASIASPKRLQTRSLSAPADAQPQSVLVPASEPPSLLTTNNEHEQWADAWIQQCASQSIGLRRELQALYLEAQQEDDPLLSLPQFGCFSSSMLETDGDPNDEEESRHDANADRLGQAPLKPFVRGNSFQSISFADSLISDDVSPTNQSSVVLQTTTDLPSATEMMVTESILANTNETTNSTTVSHNNNVNNNNNTSTVLLVGEAALDVDPSSLLLSDNVSRRVSQGEMSATTFDNIVQQLSSTEREVDTAIEPPLAEEMHSLSITQQTLASHSTGLVALPGQAKAGPVGIVQTSTATLPPALQRFVPHHLSTHSISSHRLQQQQQQHARLYEELFSAVYSLALSRQQSDLLKYSISLFERFKCQHDAAKKTKKQLMELQKSHHIFDDEHFLSALQQSMADRVQDEVDRQSNLIVISDSANNHQQDSLKLWKALKSSDGQSTRNKRKSQTRSHVGVHVSELSLTNTINNNVDQEERKSLKQFDEDELRAKLASSTLGMNPTVSVRPFENGHDTEISNADEMHITEHHLTNNLKSFQMSDTMDDEDIAHSPAIHLVSETARARAHFNGLAHIAVVPTLSADKTTHPLIEVTTSTVVTTKIGPDHLSAAVAQQVVQEHLDNKHATQWYKSLSNV